MKQDWDKFWSGLESETRLLGRFLSFYRIQIIARALNYYINKYFAREGIFIECGAGASETTLQTRKGGRKFIALDHSAAILRKAKMNPKIDGCINADIFSLPFQDGSVEGIWNVGVMEHFRREEIGRILREFRRVLKEGGRIILFWPPVYAPYEIFINIVEFLVNRFSGKRFRFYPEEVSRLRSRAQAGEILRENGFREEKTYFNFRDAFSFAVVTGTK